MIIIGKNPVIEILRSSPSDVNKIIILKNLKTDSKNKEIIKLAEENGISLQYLNKYDFQKFFSNKDKKEGITQGIIGFSKDYKYKSLKEITEKSESVRYPLLLILDSITDPHNLGAIIRSAVCLGGDGIIIPRHNSAEINHTVIKSSSGAVNFIPIAKETNLVNSILYLKSKGYFIFGTDIRAESLIFETDFRLKSALIIGSEGSGIRKSLQNNCDKMVRIPMGGNFNSLNASVSAAVFLYEIFRQKNLK